MPQSDQSKPAAKLYAIKFSNGWHYAETGQSADDARSRGLEVVEYLPTSKGVFAELVTAIRKADRAFESEGGGTRHYVRDCLIPELECAGLAVVRAALDEERQG